jgi:hypothetical protein
MPASGSARHSLLDSTWRPGRVRCEVHHPASTAPKLGADLVLLPSDLKMHGRQRQEIVRSLRVLPAGGKTARPHAPRVAQPTVVHSKRATG